jgi:hypothetical protein
MKFAVSVEPTLQPAFCRCAARCLATREFRGKVSSAQTY